MDDKGDSEYSRAPELEDLVSLCKALNDQGARYLLIGGFAVILHGAVRTTKDIDFLIDPSDENVQKIKRAMAILPDNAISLIGNDEVSKYEVVRIADEVVVDLMAKACGIDYSEAAQGIEWMEVEGIRIPIASKTLLIRMKETIRPSDKMDVEFLHRLIAAESKPKKK